MRSTSGTARRFLPSLIVAGVLCAATFGSVAAGMSQRHDKVAIPARFKGLIAADRSCITRQEIERTCTSFDFTYLNTDTVPSNGLTIQMEAPNTITAFRVTGQPDARPTGVQNAWAIYPFVVAPGAMVSGTGMTSMPLVLGAKFTVYGTSDGFATATGQDIMLTLPPHDPKLVSANRDISHAIALEARALRLLKAYKAHGKTAKDLKVLEHTVTHLLAQSVNALDAALGHVALSGASSGAQAEIRSDLEDAIHEDGAAEHDATKAKPSLRHQEGEIALAIAEKKHALGLVKDAT